MTKEKFIQEANQRTTELENALESIFSNIQGYGDYELDWRDDTELEIHFDKEGDIDQSQDVIVIEALKAQGFDVEQYDWRYSQTLRINFKDSYYGSFGLEDYSEDDWDEFIEMYDIMINEA